MSAKTNTKNNTKNAKNKEKKLIPMLPERHTISKELRRRYQEQVRLTVSALPV